MCIKNLKAWKLLDQISKTIAKQKSFQNVCQTLICIPISYINAKCVKHRKTAISRTGHRKFRFQPAPNFFWTRITLLI